MEDSPAPLAPAPAPHQTGFDLDFPPAFAFLITDQSALAGILVLHNHPALTSTPHPCSPCRCLVSSAPLHACAGTSIKCARSFQAKSKAWWIKAKAKDFRLEANSNSNSLAALKIKSLSVEGQKREC
jgi:hypothetical protein